MLTVQVVQLVVSLVVFGFVEVELLVELFFVEVVHGVEVVFDEVVLLVEEVEHLVEEEVLEVHGLVLETQGFPDSQSTVGQTGPVQESAELGVADSVGV